MAMTLNGELHVVPDVGAAFADMVQEEFASRSRPDDFVFALGGGSAPRLYYEALLATNIDWNIVTLIWGDERMVPADDPDSNYAAAKSVFLDKIGAFKAVHRMDSAQGAAAYEAVVRGLLPIDVAHLGMGEDGHTLSLFPGSPALQAPESQLVLETGDDLHPHPRMTLTFGAMKHTRLAIFTIAGAKKAEMFRRIQAGGDYPAAHVQPERTAWIADPPAVGLTK
jgi:6-phosphogluconolactonase